MREKQINKQGVRYSLINQILSWNISERRDFAHNTYQSSRGTIQNIEEMKAKLAYLETAMDKQT